MKTLIIEDEAPAFRRLQRILEEIEKDIEIIDVIDSVEESVKWLKNHQLPDLIFMDIQLADGLSFDIFKEVEINTPVIFTTAFDEYTLKAFKVNSIDYLLKPINKELLKDSLNKYKNLRKGFNSHSHVDLNAILQQINPEQKRYKSRFLVKVRDQLISIEAANIAYFFTDSGVVYAKTLEGKKYLIDFTLDELESCMDPKQFYRVNRQYIINYDAIEKTFQWDKGKLKLEIKPETSEIVLISREKASDFKKWLDMN